MYSRYHNHLENPIQIPENYSGSAFSSRRFSNTEEKKNDPPHRIDVAKPTPLTEKTQPTGMAPPRPILLPPPKEEPEVKPPPPPKTPEKKESGQPSVLPSALQSLFGSREHMFPFAHGIGFDELLIMGLILLLSRNGQENDLILWLVLLLFCG